MTRAEDRRVERCRILTAMTDSTADAALRGAEIADRIRMSRRAISMKLDAMAAAGLIDYMQPDRKRPWGDFPPRLWWITPRGREYLASWGPSAQAPQRAAGR